MTPEQRYLFDVSGYLHLKNVLTTEEVSSARDAAERYMNSSQGDLESGFTINGKSHEHGFAFDKALEALVFHPSTWSIVKELTNNKPQLALGTMLVDHSEIADSQEAQRLHCAREDFGWESTRYEVRNGRIYCDDFVVFPYLADVNPGDGGLVVVPGSHKTPFPRPKHLFDGGKITDAKHLPPGIVNLTPSAGDVVIISELLTHGALPWRPKNRYRCVLVLRYRPQHRGESSIPESVKSRLSPETLELLEHRHHTHVKEIVSKDFITLSD